MSEANKQRAMQFFNALGAGDAATLQTLITDDIEVVTPGTAEICGVRNHAVVMAICNAFPQITRNGVKFEVITLTAEGDRVACELQGRSTMVNGAAYDNTYHFLVHFRGDKICRVKEYLDTKLADAVLGPYLA